MARTYVENMDFCIYSFPHEFVCNTIIVSGAGHLITIAGIRRKSADKKKKNYLKSSLYERTILLKFRFFSPKSLGITHCNNIFYKHSVITYELTICRSYRKTWQYENAAS